MIEKSPDLDNALEKIVRLTSPEFANALEAELGQAADPLQATINLERWLSATSNPFVYAEVFQGHRRELAALLLLLGSSQPIADTLIQNPEFGYLFLDFAELEKRFTVQGVVDEGRKLLSSSDSFSYSLDRIRYLKQKFNLVICINDLSGSWPQEEIWKALSDVADAVIVLTLEVAWRQFRLGKSLPADCPVAVIGFGKLGGRELNYSSDIDLAYVLPDGVPESLERECSRFCANFGRALSDRMGRGALYRIDLRLRPYGGAGPILSGVNAFATYYRLYAEPWEIQALIKSRVVVGESVRESWAAIKSERAFSTSLSDSSLAEVIGTRRRIEEHAGNDDLKRGPGGIRDVEFLCQTLQLVYGKTHPAITLASTCDALRALSEEHLLDASISNVLVQGYTFLRKLEHRIQLLGDRQTHSVPSNGLSRKKLAHTMGYSSWDALQKELDLQRRTIRSLYKSLLKQEEEQIGARELLAESMKGNASSFLQWFDALPESEAYYRSLSENKDSFTRVRRILECAPRLIPKFKSNLNLTEMLLSGEIEEEIDPAERIRSLPLDATEQMVGDRFSNTLLICSAQWVLSGNGSLEADLAATCDELLVHCAKRFTKDLDIVGLGSYGSGQMGLNSDIDVLLLTRTGQQSAEVGAQAMLNFLLQLRRYGVEETVDLRLRPEGRKGLLVRSYDGFGAYEVGDMEMWERFALGHARLILGSEDAMDIVRHAAYANALSPDRLADLVAMKGRIENERLKPQHVTRDIKLGHGGLNDIEWIIHLHEMLDPQAVDAGSITDMRERIKALGRAGVFNALEVQSLLEALGHLLAVRRWIDLLQFPKDLVPENPDKLERLALAYGTLDGNEFLRIHEPIVAWVRTCFTETLTRISA